MPTYGYRCQACGLEFELWQRMTDQPAAACPNCGGAGRRLIFPAGIVFKGTGFYKTDSRKTSGDGAATTSAPARSKEGDTSKPARSDTSPAKSAAPGKPPAPSESSG